jgi:capsular polysaccharide transport system ATP-binding protein
MIRLDGVYKFYQTGRTRKVVINDVTTAFDTRKSYGVLGLNGAGKSTLLRLIGGAELPNAGRITKSVSVSWPLGFGGGFHPAMSGRENVHFLSRIYGADPRRVCDFVEDFAELGAYIDAPIQTYSSGMAARLAFGVSMAIDFDFYLVDEIVVVGDDRFRSRAQRSFDERRSRSGIMLVTHSMDLVKDYCDHGVIVHAGQVQIFENVDDAIAVYKRLS